MSNVVFELTLLIVENNPTQQYIFKEISERLGYDAYLVKSGEEALAALALAQYSAVILDVELLGINGLDVARRLRLSQDETKAHIPVIGVTSLSPIEEARRACLEAGIDDFLTKPFLLDEFRRMLLRWAYNPDRPNLKLLDKLKTDDYRFDSSERNPC
jgi:CheY-like chemotaxis protein